MSNFIGRENKYKKIRFTNYYYIFLPKTYIGKTLEHFTVRSEVKEVSGNDK